ncbi:MAG: hypothetical protein ABIV26_04525 [Candidatus Limnocylindrales bacterium]
MNDTAPAAPAKAGRIQIENANNPGASTSVDASMYQAMREALLGVLPEVAPGLTEEQMRAAVLPVLPEALYPAGERASWWCKAVQLDLEAKGVVLREPGRPLRWHRTDGGARAALPNPPRMPGVSARTPRARDTSSR